MMGTKRFVADKFADEVYALWLEEDMNAGNMPLPRGFTSEIWYRPWGKECFTSCDWIGAGRGQIDELKETQAAILRVKGGMSTREYEIAKQGGDWRKVFRQLNREQKMAQDLELAFSDNAQRDGSTSGQTVMQGSPAPPAGSGGDGGGDGGGGGGGGATGATGISLEDMTAAFTDAVSHLPQPPAPPAPPAPPDFAELIGKLPQPIVNVTTTMPGRGVERTTVTKHDERGRILEFEREEVPGA